jgi:hypothetical protein
MPIIARRHTRCSVSAIALIFSAIMPGAHAGAASFRFESVATLDAMQAYVRTAFPPGAPRAALRQAFVTDGGATQRSRPALASTEKYLYDINVCRMYVWRWNISADYDAGGALVQVWVNGEPVHAAGPQRRDPMTLPHGPHPSILKGARLRPQADLGETSLAYMVYDLDGDATTTDDQFAMGAGPTRIDPGNMGTMHVYTNVDPWRSIFDADPAERIVDYAGACPARPQ